MLFIMKKLSFTLALVAILTQSFQPVRQSVPSDPLCNSSICARIDGYPFDFNTGSKISALLNENHDVITFVFNGNMIKNKNGQTAEQKIEVAVPIKDLAKGYILNKSVTYHFNNQVFASLPNETDLFVADLEWNADKTVFKVTASFESNVKKVVNDGIEVPVLGIKGQFEDMVVKMPSTMIVQN